MFNDALVLLVKLLPKMSGLVESLMVLDLKRRCMWPFSSCMGFQHPRDNVSNQTPQNQEQILQMSRLVSLSTYFTPKSLSQWVSKGVGIRLLASTTKSKSDATCDKTEDIVPSLTREPIRPRRPFYKKFEIYRWVGSLASTFEMIRYLQLESYSPEPRDSDEKTLYAVLQRRPQCMRTHGVGRPYQDQE
jgi:hypothetical protein